ncbi:MAG TPA: metalloregulator ArsR/SmtB family transcription factor [Pirellulales bacterium]|nr:metalloregulator ArsR/SmtB family transcription factor [Pirellulales bacterium]
MKSASATPLTDSARLLKAFADPVRLRLLHLLAGGGEVCVCHLHQALELPQPTVSRHLASLRRAGLVAARKDGLWVHYRLAKPATPLHRTLIDCVSGCLSQFDVLRDDRHRLQRLAPGCESSE